MSNNIAIRDDLMLDTRRALLKNEDPVRVIIFFFGGGGGVGRKHYDGNTYVKAVNPDQKW